MISKSPTSWGKLFQNLLPGSRMSTNKFLRMELVPCNYHVGKSISIWAWTWITLWWVKSRLPWFHMLRNLSPLSRCMTPLTRQPSLLHQRISSQWIHMHCHCKSSRLQSSTIVLQGSLYLTKWAGPNIATAVAFLTTRVKGPAVDDWNKLLCLIRYLRGTMDLPLTFVLKVVVWYHMVDWISQNSHQFDPWHYTENGIRNAITPHQISQRVMNTVQWLCCAKYQTQVLDLHPLCIR